MKTVIFGKTPTQVNITEQLKQLITEYQQGQQELADGCRLAKSQLLTNAQTELYTAEGLREQYNRTKDKLLTAAKNKAVVLNAKAVRIVVSVKADALKALYEVEKSKDYATSINNALQFVQIEGENITDETAAQILKGFANDIETMQRFRSVIEKQVAARGEQITDAYGHTAFPQTFGKLYHAEAFAQALAELEEMASGIFLNKLTQTETEFLHGVSVSVPTDSYIQLITERNIIEQAETVEAMLAELFTVID